MKRYPILLLCILVLLPLLIDAYLIHRSYAYFGGGALNRPYALVAYEQYLFYIGEALLYDFVVLSFFTYLFIYVYKALGINNEAQKLYLASTTSFLMFLYFAIFNMEVAAYFGGKFNKDILVELTAGNLFNAFSFLSKPQLYLIIVLLLLPIVNLLLSNYILKITLLKNQFEKNFSVYKKIIFTLFIVLLGNHFLINPLTNLNYGLSNKFSFALVDLVLKSSSDFDQDGFGPLTKIKDSDNFNSSINPFAYDVPNNGIDENGLAGDFIIKSDSSVKEIQERKASLDKNVIVVVVETFRNDVVNTKLNSQLIMPFFSKLTNQYSYTPYMYSNYGVTAKAIQTIFAGNVFYNDDSSFLFDTYKNAGYKAIAISAQSEDWGNTDKILGFGEYDYFYDARSSSEARSNQTDWDKMKGILATIDSKELNPIIFTALEKYKNDKFAMYINYQDLHYPYYSDEMDLTFIEKGRIDSSFFKQNNRDEVFKQYANAAFHLDKSIEQLIKKLKQLNLMKDTVVVFVGDHPDSFYENGILGHAWKIDKYQRQTPFLVINGQGSVITPLAQDDIYNIVLASSSSATNEPKLSFTLNKNLKKLMITGRLDSPVEIGLIGVDGVDVFSFDREITTETDKDIIYQWEKQRFYKNLNVGRDLSD